jgi:maleate isomerase
MYGTRAKIGLIVPSINMAIEPEFAAMVPEGFSVHTTRVPLSKGTIEGEKKMLERTDEAIEIFKGTAIDILVYACTTASVVKGKGWDEKLIKKVEKVVGVPATTTLTSIMFAIRRLDITRIALALPYPDELNELERKYFEAEGLNVVSMKGLGATDMIDVSLEETYELVLEADIEEAQAVFISCTGLRSLELIDPLEKELNKPVFSSNTATLWNVLRILGIKDSVRGCGRLFDGS